MSRAVLSLGANLGDRLARLQAVLDFLGPRVVAVSAVYETAAWGDTSQPDYLNAVVVVDDPQLSAWEWLRLGQQCEDAAGRERDPDNRNAARSLDVDVITCAGQRSDHPRLTLPHPRAHQRAFVLVPWLDVEPDAVLDIDGEPHELSAVTAALSAPELAGVRRTALALRRSPGWRQ